MQEKIAQLTTKGTKWRNGITINLASNNSVSYECIETGGLVIDVQLFSGKRFDKTDCTLPSQNQAAS